MRLPPREPRLSLVRVRRRAVALSLLALGAAACGGLVESDPGAAAGEDAPGPGPCRTLEQGGECGRQSIYGPGIPCDVPLTEPPLDLDEVLVAVDCTLVTRRSDDGDDSSWQFAPGYRTIEVRGAACRALLGGARRVDVAYGCERMY